MQSNLFMFAMLALYGLSCSVALVTGGGLMVTVVTPILVPFILLPLIWRWIKGPEDTPEDELSKAKEKESVAMKLLEATDKEKDGIIQKMKLYLNEETCKENIDEYIEGTKITRLFLAQRLNVEEDLISRLLEQGTNINEKVIYLGKETTPLLDALSNKRWDIINIYINLNKISVTEVLSSGETLLYEAVYNSQPELFKEILSKEGCNNALISDLFQASVTASCFTNYPDKYWDFIIDVLKLRPEYVNVETECGSVLTLALHQGKDNIAKTLKNWELIRV